MSEHLLQSDVTIVGAGLVGMAAAIALHTAGYQVILVDSKTPAMPTTNDDAWDTRIYAISPKNAAWLQSLGVWHRLNPVRIGQMESMALWADATEKPLILAADDINADQLGFIVEAGALAQALLHTLQSLEIQTLFDCQAQVVQLASKLGESNQVTLQLQSSQNPAQSYPLQMYQVQSQLLLAADGVHSWVRAQFNINPQGKPYNHAAVVANFKVEKPHANIARQWFKVSESEHMQVLAWLPLPDNVISMVWSLPQADAEALLSMEVAVLSHAVKQAGNADLGEMTLLNQAVAFPLTLQTPQPVHENIVFIGDAAHQVHPMAGQGVNLGFRDIIDLIAVLAEKNAYQKINDAQLLKRYTRQRKADVANMVLLTDGLYRLFSQQNPLLKKVRHWGFEATKHKALKRLLVSQAVHL